jgi:predicted metal-dependent peptidase
MSTATTQNKDISKKFQNLLGPTDPKIDHQAREKMTTARVGMLLRASFFGNMATRLTLVNADEWCPTAATDGRKFYYNSRFVNMLRDKELEFLFGHEVLHCVYDHFGRRDDRNPMLWNVANDYRVNADLVTHRIGELITTVPCLYDRKYDGLTSEEIYDILYNQAEKINLDDLVDRMIDEHLEADEDGRGSDGLDDEDRPPNSKRPVLSEEERDEIRKEIKEAMLSAASTSENASNIPLGVRRMIQDLTEPKLNWRELLRMQLESTIKSDYTWMRSSRRSWHVDAVLPGLRNDEMIDIVVAFDASGSMSDQIHKDCLGEVQGIMDSFPAFKIHIFSFDTEVYNYQTYDSDNLDNIRDYEVFGGGGTDFTAIYDFLKREQIEPKRLVVFTDGYPCGSWGDENYCDTLWVIHGSDNIQPPWGQYTYYKEEK